MRCKTLFSTFILIPLAIAAAAHGAQPGKAQAADALFQSAKQAVAKGDLATACAQFGESQRLDPAVGTLLNLADCEQRSGKFAAALDHFREARSLLAPDDFRISFADEHMAALSRRVSYLTVRLAGTPIAGTKVLRDNVEIPSASIGAAVPVDPGSHTYVVRVPGHPDSHMQVVALREGEQRTIEVSPGAENREGEADSAAAGGPSTGPSRALVYTVGGIGIAGLGVGMVTGLMTMHAASTYKAHCNTDTGQCDQAGLDAASTGRTTSVMSPIGFGVGALGIGLAAYWLLAPAKASQAAVAVSPSVDPRGAASLTLTKTF